MQYIKLGEVIQSAKSERAGDGDYPVLSITKSDGIVLQTEKFKKRIASQDTTQYRIVRKGQLVQGIHIDEANFGIQDIIEVGIVSPAYKIWDVNTSIIKPKYLEEVLRSPRSIQYYSSKFNGSIKRRERLSDKDFLEMVIPCPSIEEQDYVLAVIKKTREIIYRRQHEMLKLDELIKARFVEMFGDMLVNPKGLPEQRLDSLADIVSGITKGRKVKTDELYEVPYMAVSNVKDGYIDWTTVKTIMATAVEIDQYRLVPGDVLMTEGGDPDKLGRGAIIHEPPKDCIHQNHIFRVRLKQDILLSIFMAQYLQQQKAKRYFLGCAKQTTGIASINMRQLSALPVLVPPMKEQEEYAAFVAQVDKSKSDSCSKPFTTNCCFAA